MESYITAGNCFNWIFLFAIDWQQFPVSILIAAVCCIFFIFSTLILAGAEKAMFSFSSKDLEVLNKRSKRGYAAFQKLIEQPQLLIATIHLLLTLVSTGLIILITYISLYVTWPVQNIWWPYLPEIFLVATMMVLIMHIIPTALSEKNNVTWTMLILPGLSLFSPLFFPFSKLILYSEKKVNQTINDPDPVNINSNNTIVDGEGNEENKQELRLLKGIMKFGSIQVKQIMKPRPDVIAVDEILTFKEVIKIIKDSGYSRIPVYRESLDNIIGTLYTKDFLGFLQNENQQDWKKIIRPAFFVPEGKKISELLIEFQSKMIHQATVIDEYGSTAGIVTLEDILEEIIGEIRDELDDKTETEFTKIDNNTFVFEGKVLLNDVYRIMGIKNQPFEEIKGDIDSIGGLVMELSGKIPDVNDELAYENFRFKVTNMNERRVGKVKVSKVEAI